MYFLGYHGNWSIDEPVDWDWPNLNRCWRAAWSFLRKDTLRGSGSGLGVQGLGLEFRLGFRYQWFLGLVQAFCTIWSALSIPCENTHA